VKRLLMCVVPLLSAVPAAAGQAPASGQLAVRLSWGHTANAASEWRVSASGTNGLEVRSTTPRQFERGDTVQNGAVRSRAGANDVDAIDLVLAFPDQPRPRAQNVHWHWTELLAASDPDTARRLGHDPAFSPGAPALTIQLDAAGTRGFTVTVDQLRADKAIWIPGLDVYLTSGAAPVSYEDHMRALEATKGRRTLDRVRTEPEASYEQFTSLWRDMGSPLYENPHQVGPGHIVGLTWDSAIPKFGIDRASGVWNDYGNPDKFRFWFGFGDLAQGVAGRWKGQRLQDGLPVMTTTFEHDGVQYEVEQFAYPLNGPPKERTGNIPMVLLQQVTLRELNGTAREVPIAMTHERQLPQYADKTIGFAREGSAFVLKMPSTNAVLLAIEGLDEPLLHGTRGPGQNRPTRLDATASVNLPARGTARFVVKLPSPTVSAKDVHTLAAIDYTAAREATLKFWSDYVERGAKFTVPEEIVNDMFRASLWHALRLPRRHGGSGPDVSIDLPYSNFAYSQTGTPWPVNQAVYVDYMLYDLRGYHAISTEELLAQYRNNQEADGHVNGYANWLVYTPSMLYTVAQNYLLSNDRAAFERLLPPSLKALDWCISQLAHASASETGLVRGPLNDGTGEGLWAFNQGYMFAGLDLFGRALERYGHARAAETREAAQQVLGAVASAFGAASMKSPIVQLRDGTWMPYVPTEALTHGRLVHEWYPTDVDTGAEHLLRLKALPARGVLADALLNDHEDNLFYKDRGMAQEPIYNQQATAYLFRDEPEAVVRAFYSYLASAFSHSVLEPVEHRWGNGQYFGPPSTDGAWFELYRNMLVHERDDDVLAVAQATPRAWLRDGQAIELERVPTYYGNVSARIESHAAAGEIRAAVQLPDRRPGALHVRFRHPEKKAMQSVTVNGQPWQDFDAAAEWVRVPKPTSERYEIVVRY